MKLIRLHVAEALAATTTIRLGTEQARYLTQVMRCRAGDQVLVFNGRDGEWRAVLEEAGKRDAALGIEEATRSQVPEPGPILTYAPLRRQHTEWLVEKATELGATALRPVRTTRTQGHPLKPERLRAIVTEAAEQCERLTLPELLPELGLAALLASRDATHPLYVGDETGGGEPFAALLATHGPGDILVGPEGGFTPEERASFAAAGTVRRMSLGPLILRAETAAIAALAIYRSAIG